MTGPYEKPAPSPSNAAAKAPEEGSEGATVVVGHGSERGTGAGPAGWSHQAHISGRWATPTGSGNTSGGVRPVGWGWWSSRTGQRLPQKPDTGGGRRCHNGATNQHQPARPVPGPETPPRSPVSTTAHQDSPSHTDTPTPPTHTHQEHQDRRCWLCRAVCCSPETLQTN